MPSENHQLSTFIPRAQLDGTYDSIPNRKNYFKFPPFYQLNEENQEGGHLS